MSVDADLVRLLKRLKLGQLVPTLPERLTLARAQQLDYAQFLTLLLADAPFHQRSRAYRIPDSTCGLSRGDRTRAGSRINPRAQPYSRKARVGRGLRASGPATAAGKLSMIRRTGRPPKNCHARSKPSIVASTVCWSNG